MAVDKDGNIYLADTANHAIRKGLAALPDAPVVEPASGRAGTLRRLEVANSAATSWSWTMIRCPATSATQLWSAAIRNPTLTPDVDDLYVLRLRGQDPAGRVAIRTLTLSGANPSLLILRVSRSSFAGSVDFQLDGPAGTTGAIEFSENLNSWTLLVDFSITNSPASWSKVQATEKGVFYRAMAK